MIDRNFDRYDWRTFLGRPPIEGDEAKLLAAHEGKTILLTGAGGSIGSALALKLTSSGVRKLILLENSEQNLYQIHRKLSEIATATHAIPVLGDIADRPLLDDLFSRHNPEIICNAAAFKHVPLMEANPLAAVRNNVVGTYTLATAVADHGAEKLVMISTDKAVDPVSVMGVSKRMAELALMALGNDRTPMNSVRLGNVLGSQGSVGLLFMEQILSGGPVTVTHPEVRRYFLTLTEAVGLVLSGTCTPSCGGVWVPELGPPRKVLDLAEHLIRHARPKADEEIPINFIGLRPGDKMLERLVSGRESREVEAFSGLYRVHGPQMTRRELDSAMAEITAILNHRDLGALLRALESMVPEYRPNASQFDAAACREMRTHTV